MSKRYSEEEVGRALRRMAIEAGNTEATSRALGIPSTTLLKWRKGIHAEQYERIRQEVAEMLDRDLAEEMHGVVRERMDILQGTAALAKNALAEGDTSRLKDLAAADKGFATTAGILTGNNRVLRDKPSEITERRADWSQMSTALKKLGVIDSTAEEIHDAEVVDSPALTEGDEG